mmetsp:Transcript_20559/g.40386  ORF Transcript_20559/g.40386 Transcript_20559/m.40386 type:complete len:329 (+) Transcript_20559:239-1225(+)
MSERVAFCAGISLGLAAWFCFSAHLRSRRRQRVFVEAASHGVKSADDIALADVGALRIVQGTGHGSGSASGHTGSSSFDLVGKLSGRPCLAFLVDKVRLVEAKSPKAQNFFKSSKGDSEIPCQACGRGFDNSHSFDARSKDAAGKSSKRSEQGHAGLGQPAATANAKRTLDEVLVERDGDQLEIIELAESRSSPRLALDLHGIPLTDGRSFVYMDTSTEIFSEPASDSNPRTVGFRSREKILPLNAQIWAFGVVRRDLSSGGYIIRPLDDGTTVFVGNRSYAQSLDFLAFTTQGWLVASVACAVSGAALFTASLTGSPLLDQGPWHFN